MVKKQWAILVLLCCACGAMAANLMNLNIDFGREDYRSFFHKLWGEHAEVVATDAGMALSLGAHTAFTTAALPYYSGTIKVSFDARCSDITPAGESYQIGTVELTYLRGGKGLYHDDLFLEGKAQEWKHYESELTPRSGVSAFTVSAGNNGKDGTLEIRNLKIKVELPGRNLLVDGSFEGMFGLDNWLQMRDGVDWDNALLATPSGKSEAVTGLFPGPGASARLTDTATVISRRFPYNGEGVLCGAWVKRDEITRGPLPWATATLQLVELDEAGRHIGHYDLFPTDPGSGDWQFYQMYLAKLSARTRSVELWLRVFDGATGTMTVDETALVLLGEGAKRRPYNPAEGTLTVSAPSPEADVIQPVWNGVDLSYVSYMGHPILKETLRQLRDAGIEYVRSREFLQGPNVLRAIDAEGNMTLDFTQLDEWLDYGVLELGLKLVPTLETTPLLLSGEEAEGRHDAHPYPPKDPEKWGRFVKEVVRHWIERYGAERVSEWVFECWNEPEASGFYKGTEAQFAQIFAAYMRALTELEAEYGIQLNIATPSGASVHGSYFTTSFDAAREAGLIGRMKSASMHVYGGFAGPIDNYANDVAVMRKTLAMYPEITDPEIHITEFNGTAMVSGYFDTQVDAAFLIRVMQAFLDSKITRSYFYCAGDHPYIKADTHFNGDLGIFTSSGMPKPVFNSYLILQDYVGGERLAVESSNEPFNALAVLGADGRLHVVVTSFNEQDLDATDMAKVTLKITLPTGYEVSDPTLRRIDSVHANSHTAFVRDGSPLVKDHPDTTAWAAAGEMESEPVTDYCVNGDTLTVTLEMELNSVAALDL